MSRICGRIKRTHTKEITKNLTLKVSGRNSTAAVPSGWYKQNFPKTDSHSTAQTGSGVCIWKNAHNQIPDLRVQPALKLRSYSAVRRFLLLWNPPVCHRIHHGSAFYSLVPSAVYILHTTSSGFTLILFFHIRLIPFSVLFSYDFAVKLSVHFSLPPISPV